MANFRLIFIVFLFFLVSCSQKSDIKIGFLMPSGEGYRWPTDQAYIEKAAEKYGCEVISKDANNDENLQLKLASELLESGVDVLIVVPMNSNTAAGIVREAHDYNVPVIAYDRLIKNSDLDYFISFAGDDIANLMLDHAIQKVPKGNYVLLWGDQGDLNAFFIKDAQEERLKSYVENGDINIVYKGFVDNWNTENAYHLMDKILSYSDQDIDAVITSYDGLAMGAIKAIEEHSVKTVKVLTGQDAEITAIKSLLDNKMTLTVYKSIRKIANASVDLAVKLAKDERIDNSTSFVNNGRKDVPALMIKPVAVQKDNIRATVIADEFYTEEEVYGK